MRPKVIEDKSYWLKHIERYKASGLNKSKYCARHNITYHNFLYWLSKLTNQPLQSQPTCKISNNKKTFIKVKLDSDTKANKTDCSAKPLCILELLCCAQHNNSYVVFMVMLSSFTKLLIMPRTLFFCYT